MLQESTESRVRVLIVDDEAPSRHVLRHMLGRWPGAHVVGECRTAADALRAVLKEQPDVVFLDVNMPGQSGLSLATGMDESVPVVFVTAHREYASEAFDVAAADYLVKPFSEERFDQCFRRVLARLERDRAADAANAGAVAQNGAKPLERLMVRDRDVTRLIAVSDIAWIEAVDVYVRIHLQDGSAYLLREVLSDMEERLSSRMFVRVHRSYLVNVSCIEQIRRRSEGNFEIVLQGGRILRMARARRADLQARLRAQL